MHPALHVEPEPQLTPVMLSCIFYFPITECDLHCYTEEKKIKDFAVGLPSGDTDRYM